MSDNQIQLSQSYLTPQEKLKTTYLENYCVSKDEYNLVDAIFYPPLEEDKHKVFMIDILAKWRWSVGISANQDEDDLAKELSMLFVFIKENFSNLTIKEIDLAINLSLTNKLNCDVNAYNSFSPLYVSRILNAYIEYKKQNVEKIKERKDLVEKRNMIEKKVTPEEKYESMLELITYFYDKFKEEGKINDIFNTLYGYFKRVNLLKELPKELIDEALEYGKKMSAEETQGLFLIKSVTKPDKEMLQKRYARNFVVQRIFADNTLETLHTFVKKEHFV